MNNLSRLCSLPLMYDPNTFLVNRWIRTPCMWRHALFLGPSFQHTPPDEITLVIIPSILQRFVYVFAPWQCRDHLLLRISGASFVAAGTFRDHRSDLLCILTPYCVHLRVYATLLDSCTMLYAAGSIGGLTCVSEVLDKPSLLEPHQ